MQKFLQKLQNKEDQKRLFHYAVAAITAIFLSLYLAPLNIHASTFDVEWTDRWTSLSKAPDVQGIAQDADSVYTVGFYNDWFVQKNRKSDGVSLWQRSSNPQIGVAEPPRDIAVDSTGVYIVGEDYIPSGSGFYQNRWRIEKRSLGSGNILWIRNRDWTGNGSNDVATEVEVDNTGVYVAGISLQGSTVGVRIEKYSKNNGFQWTQTSKVSSNPEWPVSMTIDDTGVYVGVLQADRIEKRDKSNGGLMWSKNTSYNHQLVGDGTYVYGSNGASVRANRATDGVVQWTRTAPGASAGIDIAEGLAQTSNVVVLMYRGFSFGTALPRFFVVQADGTVVDDDVFNGENGGGGTNYGGVPDVLEADTTGLYVVLDMFLRSPSCPPIGFCLDFDYVYRVDKINYSLNTPPTVSIAAPADGHTAREGDSISFDGTVNDPDTGDTLTYEWRRDACTTGTPLNSNEDFSTDTLPVGTHTIFFRAFDGTAWSTCADIDVTVNANQVPAVSITAPVTVPGGSTGNYTASEGETVTFTATSDDPDGSVTTNAWYTTNNCSGSVVSNNLSYTKTFNTLGSADMSFRAQDNDNEWSSCAHVAIAVTCPGGTTDVAGVCVANGGVCGSATTTAHTAAPGSNLCADNTTFVLGSMGEITAGWEWECAGAVDTASCSAAKVPDITIQADPDLIRSGQQADLTVTIDADWDLSCSVLNAQTDPIAISHTANPSQQTYPDASDGDIKTRPLTHAQIVSLFCAYPAPFNTLPPAATSTRIEVVPTYEEI